MDPDPRHNLYDSLYHRHVLLPAFVGQCGYLVQQPVVARSLAAAATKRMAELPDGDGRAYFKDRSFPVLLFTVQIPVPHHWIARIRVPERANAEHPGKPQLFFFFSTAAEGHVARHTAFLPQCTLANSVCYYLADTFADTGSGMDRPADRLVCGMLL